MNFLSWSRVRVCNSETTQTSEATGEVARNITGVREAAENSSAAATQVLSASRDLARQSEALRGEVHKFLTAVRAA